MEQIVVPHSGVKGLVPPGVLRLAKTAYLCVLENRQV